MGSVCLLFEVSTIFLNAQNLLSALTDWHVVITATRGVFAVTFIIFRIFIGVTASFEWFIDTYARLVSGDTHSVFFTSYYLVVNILLNLLNLFWAYIIIRKMFEFLYGNKNKAQ